MYIYNISEYVYVAAVHILMYWHARYSIYSHERETAQILSSRSFNFFKVHVKYRTTTESME